MLYALICSQEAGYIVGRIHLVELLAVAAHLHGKIYLLWFLRASAGNEKGPHC